MHSPKMYLLITGGNRFAEAMTHADRGEGCSEKQGHTGHDIALYR